MKKSLSVLTIVLMTGSIWASEKALISFHSKLGGGFEGAAMKNAAAHSLQIGKVSAGHSVFFVPSVRAQEKGIPLSKIKEAESKGRRVGWGSGLLVGVAAGFISGRMMAKSIRPGGDMMALADLVGGCVTGVVVGAAAMVLTRVIVGSIVKNRELRKLSK